MGQEYDSPRRFAADRLRAILYEQDTRNFLQLLSDWVAHEGGEGVFLHKTGLGGVLSPDSLREMELGTLIPSKRLACVMAAHLPGGTLRRDEETRRVRDVPELLPDPSASDRQISR